MKGKQFRSLVPGLPNFYNSVLVAPVFKLSKIICNATAKLKCTSLPFLCFPITSAGF